MKVIQRIRRNKEYTFHSLTLWYIWNKDNFSTHTLWNEKMKNQLYYSNTFQCYKIQGFWGTFVFLFKTWLQIIGRFIRWSTEALPSSRDMVQWQGTRIGRSNQKLKDFHFHLEPCSAVFSFYFLFCCDKNVRVYCRQVMQMFNYMSRDTQ